MATNPNELDWQGLLEQSKTNKQKAAEQQAQQANVVDMYNIERPEAYGIAIGHGANSIYEGGKQAFNALGPQAFLPTEDMRNKEGAKAYMLAAGSGLNNLYQGGKDIASALMTPTYSFVKRMISGEPAAQPAAETPAPPVTIGAQNNQELAAKRAEDERLYGQLTGRYPYVTAAGDATPRIAAAIAAPGTIPAQMGVQGAIGALEYGTPQERTKRAVVDAGLVPVGAAAGGLINKALKPLTQSLTPSMEAAMAAAERIGYRPQLSAMTGQAGRPNPIIRAIEAPPEAAQVANQQAINAAAARSMGQSGDSLGSDILQAARNEMGAKFDAAFANKQINLGKPFRDALDAATPQNAIPALRSIDADTIVNQLKAYSVANQQVPADWIKTQKSLLDNKIRSAYNSGQDDAARALEGIEKVLDNSLRSSMNATEKVQYNELLKKWANLRTLETKGATKGGNVDPKKVADILERRYSNAYKEGKLTGELPDMARIAESLMVKPAATTGNFAQFMANPFGRSAAGAGIGGALFGPPGVVIGGLAPVVAQKGLNTELVRKWLTTGLGQIPSKAVNKGAGVAGALGNEGY